MQPFLFDLPQYPLLPAPADDWVLDITLGADPPCFVAWDSAGKRPELNARRVIAWRCPGVLVGVISGDEAAEEAVRVWCARHPDWKTRYGSASLPQREIAFKLSLIPR